MNIVRENIGILDEHVTVELVPEDYQEAVAKTLRDLKRRASIPGFRVGHVPMGMIERQYKASVMLDEISKKVNEEIEKYLRENKIRILFEPLAVPEKTKADFEKMGEFSFTFEIGLRPEVKIDYAKAKDVPYLKVTASEAQIDEEVAKLRRRLGKFSSTEEVVDGDMALVQVVTEEGAEPISSSLPTSYFKESCRNEFIGKKVHDTMVIDLKEMFETDYERSTLLKRRPTEMEDAPEKVTVTINAIHHVDPAEMDDEFYSRAFPDGQVKDEAAMRSRLKAQIERGYDSQERMQYRGAAMDALMAGMELTLPDSFVKRYMIERNPELYTAESMEERYPDLQKSIVFQLVENTISEDGNLNIGREDILDYLRRYFSFNYFGLDYAMLSEEYRQQVESLAGNMLKEEKTISNVYDNIQFERIADIIFEKSGGVTKSVSLDEFLSGSGSTPAPAKPKKTRSRKTEEKAEAPAEEVKETKAKKPSARKTAAKKEQQ